MNRKLISIELNEVPYEILDYYTTARPKSNLASALPRCKQYTTISPDIQPLSPWTTWPTQHRGVQDTIHKVHSLGQNVNELNRTHPAIWTTLVGSGVSTGVFGSLHTSPLPDNYRDYAFYVPDTFAIKSDCWPSELTAFQEFNLTMVRQSGRNVARGIDTSSGKTFLRHAHSLGLRMSTAALLVRHLVKERIRPWSRVRRRSLQSVIAFDLFEHQVEQTKPQYAAFFTNHVASSMHRYWLAAFPEQYESNEFGADWIERFSDEILFAMDVADRFFGEARRFVDNNPEYRLVVSSSMGQGPAKSKPLKTKVTIVDLDKLMRAGGFAAHEFERRSAMDANIGVVVDPSRVHELVAFLQSISIEGRPLKPRIGDGGFVSWWMPGVNLPPEFNTIYRGEEPLTFAQLGIVNLKVDDEADSTAYHRPEGCLFIYDPNVRYIDNRRAPVSTLDVAPFMLDYFGLTVPDYMNAPGVVSAENGPRVVQLRDTDSLSRN